MRLLVCGSRSWDRWQPIFDKLVNAPSETVIVEGCARGADQIAETAASFFGLQIEHHPADWSLGRRAGLLRTLEMFEYPLPDLVYAFWDGESRGTGFTIATAKRRGIPVEVIR